MVSWKQSVCERQEEGVRPVQCQCLWLKESLKGTSVLGRRACVLVTYTCTDARREGETLYKMDHSQLSGTYKFFLEPFEASKTHGVTLYGRG